MADNATQNLQDGPGQLKFLVWMCVIFLSVVLLVPAVLLYFAKTSSCLLPFLSLTFTSLKTELDFHFSLSQAASSVYGMFAVGAHCQLVSLCCEISVLLALIVATVVWCGERRAVSVDVCSRKSYCALRLERTGV